MDWWTCDVGLSPHVLLTTTATLRRLVKCGAVVLRKGYLNVALQRNGRWLHVIHVQVEICVRNARWELGCREEVDE